jgi:hypothetical protein
MEGERHSTKRSVRMSLQAKNLNHDLSITEQVTMSREIFRFFNDMRFIASLFMSR